MQKPRKRPATAGRPLQILLLQHAVACNGARWSGRRHIHAHWERWRAAYKGTASPMLSSAFTTLCLAEPPSCAIARPVRARLQWPAHLACCASPAGAAVGRQSAAARRLARPPARRPARSPWPVPCRACMAGAQCSWSCPSVQQTLVPATTRGTLNTRLTVAYVRHAQTPRTLFDSTFLSRCCVSAGCAQALSAQQARNKRRASDKALVRAGPAPFLHNSPSHRLCALPTQ